MSIKRLYDEAFSLLKDWHLSYDVFDINSGHYASPIMSIVPEDNRLVIEMDTHYEYMYYDKIEHFVTQSSAIQYIITDGDAIININGVVNYDEQVIAEHALLGNSSIYILAALGMSPTIEKIEMVAEHKPAYIQNSMLSRDDVLSVQHMLNHIYRMYTKEKGAVKPLFR